MALQDNPFADLIPQAPRQQPVAPARIYGAPKRIDPAEQQRLDLAMRAAQRGDNSDLRAAAAADRAAAAAERQALLDGQKLTQEKKLNETEAKTTAFYNRALGADRDFEATNSATNPRGVFAQGVVDILPTGITNSFTSPDRQKAEQAKRDFIAASLRYESGAAISPAEFEKQDSTFFPQPGDSPEVIKQKEGARQRVIESFQIGAGTGAARVNAIRGPEGSVQFNDERPNTSANSYRLKPGQEAQIAALAQSGASATTIAALVKDFGGNASPESLKALQDFYAKPENRGIAPSQDYNQVDKVRPVDFGDGALGAAGRGLTDTATLGFADEIGGLADTVTKGGTYADNLDRRRGNALYDEQNQFGARLTGQIAGGLVLPGGGARTAGELARVGAAYGGAYGFGSSDGDIGQRTLGAAGGAATGGAAGYGLGALGNLAAARFGRGPGGGGGNATGRELLAAAGRQGIDVLPADVGGAMTRRMTAGVVQTPFGSGPIVAAAERAQGQAGTRLGQIAAEVGAPARQEALGEVGQAAAQGYIDRTGEAARQAYGNARELSQDTLVQGRGAFQNLNAQIRELAPTSNTDAPLISGLTRLRDDIASDRGVTNLSVDSIRRLRTSVRAEAQSEGLRGTDYNRRAGQVLDALSNDIASQLPPEAAAAFRTADRAYAERLNVIDDVMENVVGSGGDRSAEAVAQRLSNMSRGDSARLRTFLNSVTPEESGIVRGSLIQEMGRSSSGRQNAAGSQFSLQTFLTNWDKMPNRTRDLLFRGEHRQAIEDLARVAEGARASRAYSNTSGTAGASNSSRLVSDVGRLGSFAGATSTLGGSVVLENLTGRLLGSQRFAQWLARAPRDPARQEAWVRRLTTLASREPQIANDILPIQQALQSAISKSAANEAPADQVDNRR